MVNIIGIDNDNVVIDLDLKTITITSPNWSVHFGSNEQIEKDNLKNPDYNDISKTKLFMQVFSFFSQAENKDVPEYEFIKELISTGKFTLDECKNLINKSMQNGHIYER